MFPVETRVSHPRHWRQSTLTVCGIPALGHQPAAKSSQAVPAAKAHPVPYANGDDATVAIIAILLVPSGADVACAAFTPALRAITPAMCNALAVLHTDISTTRVRIGPDFDEPAAARPTSTMELR